MQRFNRTIKQKQAENMIQGFDRFPVKGQLKIAKLHYEGIVRKIEVDTRKRLWAKRGK